MERAKRYLLWAFTVGVTLCLFTLLREVYHKLTVSQWPASFRRPEKMVTWIDGQVIGRCFGRRRTSRLAASYPKQEVAERQARLAIIVRGHFRNTDANYQSAENLRLLLNYFPNSKVFFHTWSSRLPSHSWRQRKPKKGAALSVDSNLLRKYYRIPEDKIGGLLIESDNEVLPELRKLYTSEELQKLVCDGYNYPSLAPNIGWLQMWWGILQPSALAVRDKSAFDAVVNYRHDIFTYENYVIKDWTVIRRMVVEYLRNYRLSPTDISCWAFRLDMKTEPGCDLVWVTGLWSNFMLASKWVYEYMVMQDIFCPANFNYHQERMAFLSGTVLI